MKLPLPTLHRHFRFEVTVTEGDKTFTLPLGTGTHNFTVYWGDGSSDEITSNTDPDRIHTYTTAGTYIISMQGTCTNFAFNNAGDKLKLKKLLGFIDMGFTILNFWGCENLTRIHSSMRVLKSLTTAYRMFRECISLATIPTGIFDGSVGITTFLQAFGWCSSLTSIPIDLFRYNTSVTNFEQCFGFCTGLVSIPTDLFRYNTVATNFAYTFGSCSGLTSIPADLFKYNIVVTNFLGCFYGCIKAQYNINIFYATGEEGTRFLNKSINFTNCFYRTSFTGTQGTVPDLWNCDFGTGTATKTDCYGGAGNSETSLTNYTEIPEAWK